MEKVGLEQLQNAQRLAQSHVGLLGPAVDDRKQFSTELIGLAFHAGNGAEKRLTARPISGELRSSREILPLPRLPW